VLIIKNQVNAAFHGYRLYWQGPDETFWTNTSAAKSFVTKDFETGELAVLIVDPVALYHPDIYQRLMLFQECLTHSRMSSRSRPSACRPRSCACTALLNRGMPYFDDFFQPAIPPRRRLAAQCGWNVSDTDDIQRLILAAAGPARRESRNPEWLDLPPARCRAVIVTFSPTRAASAARWRWRTWRVVPAAKSCAW
jgi:hypothetical protein